MKFLYTLLFAFAAVSLFSQAERLSEEDELNTKISPASYLNTPDGQIDLDLEAGVGPYRYYWSGPDGFLADTEDLSNLKPGEYCVEVRDRRCGRANLCVTVPSLFQTNFSSKELSAEEFVKQAERANGQFGEVKISPNPFQNRLNLDIESENSKKVLLKLFDSNYRQVYTQDYTLEKGINSINLTANGLNPGIYILTLCDETGCRTSEKLVCVNQGIQR